MYKVIEALSIPVIIAILLCMAALLDLILLWVGNRNKKPAWKWIIACTIGTVLAGFFLGIPICVVGCIKISRGKRKDESSN
jgi:uncharacterized membrane protein